MQAPRWERVGELFAQLTLSEGGEPELVVRDACAGDPELCGELMSLLAAHSGRGPLDASPEFLLDDADSGGATELPGAVVGPYRLLRRIGEGGMGSVWLAERTDGVVKRAIALKRPHVSWIGTLAERLAEERDILAVLEHPHIARLYDAGVTDSGEPYLALEFVDGIPITQFCDDRRLSLRQRLELILQVLDAVRYAHGRLIIHRDIKPSNILVSADSRVHLLDFGIARLLGHDAGVVPGEWAGLYTPDYASLEQLRGEPISTASDVYSLGVVCYELLSGVRPYRLQSRGSAARATELRSLPLRPASAACADATRRRELQGDLDAILVKALQHDPAHRYATVDAFAVDFERHLASQPVAARPDRFGYRLEKLIARHRWQAASAAIAVAALATGFAVAIGQARQARIEATRAEQVKGFALSFLQSADTDSGAGAATTAVQLLQTARRRVEGELVDQPAIAAELMGAIGYGLIGQDRSRDALAVLDKAIALSARANGPDDLRSVVLQVMYGEALCDLGESARAISVLAPAARRAHQLRDAHAETDAWRWLSSAQIDSGDVQAALLSARAAVAALPLPVPSGRQPVVDAIQAHLGLANALISANVHGVVDQSRVALELMARLDDWRGSTHWWAARSFLGQGLVSEGQVAPGLREVRAAYEGTKALLGPDHPETEARANYLGGALLDAGEVRESVAAYQSALEAVRRHAAERGWRAVGIETYSLGYALLAAREPGAALPYLETAVQIFSAAGGAGAGLAFRARSARALALLRLGRLEDADRDMTALASVPAADPDRTLFQSRFALLRSRQGRHAEALELAAAARQRVGVMPSRARQASVLSSVGLVSLFAARRQDGITALEQALSIYREVQTSASPDSLEAEAALRAARQPGYRLNR